MLGLELRGRQYMPGGGRRENVCAVRFAFCVRGAVDAVLLFTDLVVRVDAGPRTDARAFRATGSHRTAPCVSFRRYTLYFHSPLFWVILFN